MDAHVMESLYGSLSGGQQRRVLTAVALAGSPALVVLDEPTSGVDVESRMALWGALRTVQDSNGAAFLVTTHDLGEAEQYADKVIVMRAGRVTYEGTPSGYIASSGLARVLALRSRSNLARAGSSAVLPAVDAVELRSAPREVTLRLREPAVA